MNVEPVNAPRRWWTPFNRLWYSAIGSNFADGLVQTAVPLLAARLTDDPFLISLLSAASYLPWLLFAVASGALVDRVDRRAAMALAHVGRVVVLAVLVAAILTDQAGVTLLLFVVFVLGVLETVSDSAVVAAMPTLVGNNSLDGANAKIQGAQVVVQGFLAAPAGAYLFGMFAAVPFLAGASGYAIAAALVCALPRLLVRATRTGASATQPGGPAPGTKTAPWRRSISDGALFLLRHRPLRRLWALTIVVSAAAAFAQASFVLYVLNILGVPESAYGVFLASSAAGGLLGALAVTRLSLRFGRGTMLLVSTLGEAACFAAIGLSAGPWPAAIGMFGVSSLVACWNVLSMSVRQSSIPNELLGRVHGVWRTAAWGCIPLASLAGGLVSRWNMRAPFLMAVVVIVGMSLITIRTLLSFNEKPASTSDSADEAEGNCMSVSHRTDEPRRVPASGARTIRPIERPPT